MEITFTQNINDYYNAYKYISRRLGKSTKWRFIPFIGSVSFGFFIAIGILTIISHYKSHGVSEPHTVHIALAAIALAFIIPYICNKLFHKLTKSLIFKEGGLYLSPQRFIISDTQLTHYVGECESLYPWKYILEIVKENDCLYLFIDRGVAMYIPCHAFSTVAQYNEFYEALNKHAA